MARMILRIQPMMMAGAVVVAAMLPHGIPSTNAFSTTLTIPHRIIAQRASTPPSPSLLRLSHWDDDTNAWKTATTSSSMDTDNINNEDDWESVLKKKKDGSYWQGLELELEDSSDTLEDQEVVFETEDETEARLDTLASIQAEEVTFNVREATRADTVRQMEEWGFEPSTIASALDIAVEDMDIKDEVRGMQGYREASYIAEEDLTTAESHANVPRDPDTNEPVRSQMVYVDEHACIGCTNCAMIAQSTFFMEEENGRARVFEQWGDDETTVQIAMDTCPVDCIHYVPYEDLVQLEVKRRDQYINVLAGLVSRAERGAGSGIPSSTPRSFGSKAFSAAPRISGSYSTAGENQDYVAKEKVRIFKDRRERLQESRRREGKIADL